MALIIEDASVSLIVTIATYASRADQLPVPHVLIDGAAAEIAKQSSAPLKPQEAPAEDICYILYTSGTTGRPKGVAIRHQSFVNFIRVAAASYGYRPGDRVYQGMGPLTIGRDAFVGVGSTLDIDTSIGDGAQLGHSSSLQRGQSIPDGEHWHAGRQGRQPRL